MANAAIHPAKRQILLIVTMLLALALSIGAAALLVKFKRGLWRVDLEQPQTIGSVELRIPRGWTVNYEREGEEELIKLEQSQRQLSIRVVNSARYPELHDLLESSRLRLRLTEPGDDRMAETIQVPGGTGYIFHPRHGPAVAVLGFEDGRAVFVQLESSGRSTGQDNAIIYNVTQSIRLLDAPQAPAPATPRLPSGEREI